jgi:hypothetical protein
MNKTSSLERLRIKWGLKSYFQVVLILVVFALTGLSAVSVKVWIYNYFELGDNLSLLSRILLFVCITLPVYQSLLLFYGLLFGQFRFFWEKEKKLFRLIGGLFRSKEANG